MHKHKTGLTRRESLQVGYSGLMGLGLPSILAGQARAETSEQYNAVLKGKLSLIHI